MLPLYGYNVTYIHLRTSMRILLIAFFTVTSLLAIGENTNTMQSNFTQTITNDKNSTITYKGNLLVKRPSLALWHYVEPIEKSVYITARNVTIVEPELEQAIVKKLDNNVDILAILASAKKESTNHYSAMYDDKQYLIEMKEGLIHSITYNDTFENIVTITFTKQKINKKISNTKFKPIIPLDFDIIKD